MSEKIQIVCGNALGRPEVGDDSKSTFMCHKPPNVSVLSCGQTGRLRFKIGRELTAGSGEVVSENSVGFRGPTSNNLVRSPKRISRDTRHHTRLFAGSVARSFFVERKCS